MIPALVTASGSIAGASDDERGRAAIRRHWRHLRRGTGFRACGGLRWQRPRDFVGGRAAALAWKDVLAKCGDVYFEDGGQDPHFQQLYFDKYIKLDPCTTAQHFAQIEEPVATADFIPYDQFLELRMYKEWARPQGYVDVAMSLLDKSATSMAFFIVFRHDRDGLVDAETRRRMRLIVPHIRRAALIGKAIDLRQT